MPSPAFRPRHISRQGVVTVYQSFEDTLELFTPEGERGWVPGWEPEYLYRAGGGDEIDTVFRTIHDGVETLWVVLDHDREEGTAAYSRHAIGLHIGTVTVSVEEIDRTSCWVEVTYELTSLTPAGNARLAEMTPKKFAGMMEEWGQRIAQRSS